MTGQDMRSTTGEPDLWMAGGSAYGVEVLADREAIRHVLGLYYRGIDRMDLDLVRAVYHPDAHDRRLEYDGDVDGLIDYVAARLDSSLFVATHHHMGNQVIEVDGDRARAETNVVAYHRTSGNDGPQVDITVWLRYLDRLERRAGRWKIADRFCVHDYSRIDPVTDQYESPEAILSRRQDRSDPVYDL